MTNDHPTNNAMGTSTLQGLHVLVMEDRGLIAAKVMEVLYEVGCVPVGPAATLQAGLAVMKREDVGIDAAVLDIDLRGSPVYPLAEALRSRGIPLLFLTGYGANALPDVWRGAVRVEKPFEATTLIAALVSALADHPDQAGGGVTIDRYVTGGIEQGWDVIRHSRNMVMEARLLRSRTMLVGKDEKPDDTPA
jgi:DNA-binding response OmpR family regulator